MTSTVYSSTTTAFSTWEYRFRWGETNLGSMTRFWVKAKDFAVSLFPFQNLMPWRI